MPWSTSEDANILTEEHQSSVASRCNFNFLETALFRLVVLGRVMPPAEAEQHHGYLSDTQIGSMSSPTWRKRHTIEQPSCLFLQSNLARRNDSDRITTKAKIDR